MKVTHKQLAQLMVQVDDDAKLKDLLRYVFSFQENIDIFSTFIFNEAITTRIPSFHYDLYNALFDKEDIAIAAPRGFGKSTVVGLVFISFCIVNKLERYIVYMSQNHAKTVQFIEPIRNNFSSNDRLLWLYGNLTPKATKDESGRDREDCFDVNGIRVEGVSFEKNIRGFKYGEIRPTLIIGDDIEEDVRVLNPELRVKDEQKLKKVVLPSLDVNGRFKMIGTILHVDSLLFKMIRIYNGDRKSVV